MGKFLATGGFTPHVDVWYLAGDLLYYGAGIVLAYALKDNRAFCKYVCPVAVPLKLGARLSLLKVKGDAATCTDCGACVKACPMDIKVSDYHVAEAWRDWFVGLRIVNHAGGGATLEGPVTDQAALHGLLARLRDLNLELIELKKREGKTS